MSLFNIIGLLGGLALFLYGMRVMGNGLTQGSSGTVKKAMEKVTNNPFMGFLLGLGVTAIIQSSTATIVLTSGLVGAGIISLPQSIGIIIGANVGTTVTGQIIRLLDIDGGSNVWLQMFQPSTLAPIAAIIGIVIIMAFKFRNKDTVGAICMGFAILFTGLINMTAAVSDLSSSPAFTNLLTGFSDQPFLGFVAGVTVSFVLQSSSATVGILQALAVTGQLTFGSVYPIILGIFLGDCITTAIVCSIGAKADAKRTGVIHILYNLSQLILIFAAVTLAHSVNWTWFNGYWGKAITSGGIANINSLFKLTGAVLLLPVCKVFEKLARKIIKDDEGKNKKYQKELNALDKEFYKSPEVALSCAHNLVSKMSEITCSNVKKAMKLLGKNDIRGIEEIENEETFVDEMADKASNYLIGLSPYVSAGDGNERLNYYIKCVSEFERIGDYAVNVTECEESIFDKKITFSDNAQSELKVIEDALSEIMDYTNKAFLTTDREAARHIEPVEEVIDDLVAFLKSAHIQRLREGRCNVYAGCAFMDILVNIERIADHCSNIGVHIITMLDSGKDSMEHDYIKYLHQGNDEDYNREFSETREKYFGMLNEKETV